MTDRRLPGGTPADAGDRLRLASALVEQVFARASGAPLVGGNDVRLLKDARQNYPAWLEAIGSARRTIHFESYIIHEDEIGREFALLLMARARAGVQVRIIYDWLGAVGKTSKGFWRDLRNCGVEVRCFNPPRLSNPFAWLSRDHRKMLAVDGRVGFVTGLCVGQSWMGDPARGIEPSRDTGISLRGPAVADLELAFSRMWELTGMPLPRTELSSENSTSSEADVSVRVIASIRMWGGGAALGRVRRTHDLSRSTEVLHFLAGRFRHCFCPAKRSLRGSGRQSKGA
jgi:cardiolipin synthase